MWFYLHLCKQELLLQAPIPLGRLLGCQLCGLLLLLLLLEVQHLDLAQLVHPYGHVLRRLLVLLLVLHRLKALQVLQPNTGLEQL